jgi:tetratricopeptide (TPR) repeat protein
LTAKLCPSKANRYCLSILLTFLLPAGSDGAELESSAKPTAPCAQLGVVLSVKNPAEQMESFAAQEQWRELECVASRWVQEHPEEAQAHYWVGVGRWQRDDHIGAIQALRRSQKLGLNTASFHKTLGLAYLGINQFLLFRRQMEKVIELTPQDPQPYFQLGRHFESVQNDFEQALHYYRKAFLLKPDDGRSLYYSGYCAEMLGKHEQARDAYESAVRLLAAKDDRFSWPCQRLARLLLNSDTERALEWARRAVGLEPELAANHYVLGMVYAQVKNLLQAVAEFREAVRLDPTDASAHYRLSRIFEEIGTPNEAEAARKMFERVRSAYGTQ